MKKLSYTQEISAAPDRVYDVMLGLSDKRTYEQWCAAFNPTSSWEGGWNKGDKIRFTGISEDGSKEGMVARILENDPGKYVSIEHLGMLEKGVEVTEGEKVDGWKGAHENYRFEAIANGTRLTVEVDTQDEYVSWFNETWLKALDSLKKICEGNE
ncbi:SRPBCC family protein [Fluviicola chungangensis]|uniref:SRPBCC domain-containing protein n=1 Tax=Fluviicola chungangensis TaxID=2597671 RepID=A0A556N6B4_9FLAO|nr:SRPBCC domain-containing protein [Fluviicola chungangensis]TSJ47724.1 SRPBCC domain-containing protein [Fluviicola chungangensis]